MAHLWRECVDKCDKWCVAPPETGRKGGRGEKRNISKNNQIYVQIMEQQRERVLLTIGAGSSDGGKAGSDEGMNE